MRHGNETSHGQIDSVAGTAPRFRPGPRRLTAVVLVGMLVLACAFLLTALKTPSIATAQDDATAEMVADEMPTYDRSGVVRNDPGTPLPFVGNELVVFAEQGATDEEVAASASAHGGQVVASIPDIGAYQVRFADTMDYGQIVDLASALAEEAAVDCAFPQLLMSLENQGETADVPSAESAPAPDTATSERAPSDGSEETQAAEDETPPTDDIIWSPKQSVFSSFDNPNTDEDETGQMVRYADGFTAANGLTQPVPIGWAYEAINLPEAWDLIARECNGATPGADVIVGIFDTPIYYDHEDLPEPVSAIQEDLSDEDWLETTHGTVVAGIIAARANGGDGEWGGTVGVAYGSQLVSVSRSADEVNAFAGENGGDDTTLYAAYQYVYALDQLVNQGAKVLNFSNGLALETFIADAHGLDTDAAETALEAIRTANGIVAETLIRLLNEGHDFVICKAAGNYNSLCDPVFGEDGIGGGQNAWFDVLSGIEHEALRSRIIVVGALETTSPGIYQVARYSAGGSRVDVVAPGSYVYSTSPCIPGWQSRQEAGILDQIAASLAEQDDAYEDMVGNGYVAGYGSSFATPIVSGVAALVWSINPTLSGDEVKSIICSTATVNLGYPKDDPEILYAYNIDPAQTRGMVDAEAAVYAALSSFSSEAGHPVGTYSCAPGGFSRASMTIDQSGSVTLSEFSGGTGEGTTTYYQLTIDETVTTPDGVTAYTFAPTGQDGETWQMTADGNVPTGTFPASTYRWFTYDAGTDTLTDVQSGTQWLRTE